MIRWKCDTCNKVWIYPIKKCFYCKDKITRIESKPKKVIGITKVVVPSPLHPIVPYNVMLLEDEFGNRLPRKTMKKFNVGDDFEEPVAQTADAVSIVKVKYDVYDAVKNAFELINYAPGPDDKILLKPNIESAAYPYQSVTTNPKVLDAVIRFLILHKVDNKNITVAEQSIFGIDTTKAAAKSGILKVCKKHEVSFVDLSKSEFQEVSSGDYKFNLSKEILSNDQIINLPVIKTHPTYGISAALMNMARIVDVDTQKQMSGFDFEKKIAYLNKQIKYLTLSDGTIGMNYNGPFVTGEPAFLNILFASQDPVAIDTVFSEMAMFDLPDHIKIANDIGLGESDIKNIEIVGYELDAVKVELKVPTTVSPNRNLEIIDGNSWSGEYFALYSLMGKFNNIAVKKATVLVGDNINAENLPKERLIAYGDSAISKLEESGITPMASIKGSPPEPVESYVLLKKLLTNEGEASINILDQAKSKIVSKLNKIGG